jgi:SH3-like domain-containing protein
MTEQQNDENKPQDTESGPATNNWGDVLENELANDNADETELIEETPGDETELIEESLEEETALLDEQSGQDSSSSPSDESEDISNLDSPLGEQPESEEYDLSDLYDTENDPVQTPDWQSATKSEELPDFDLPVDKPSETDEDELERMPDRQDATEESINPEIANDPLDETLAHDIPPVAANATSMLSDEMPEHQQTQGNNSSLLAVGLGLSGILVAAAAIWLNMGLSDQLAQFKTQQQPQNDAAISLLNQEKQGFAQEVEKLTELQNQQAETQLSSLETLQQQLDALTAVVATRVAKQWQASSKALPATEKPVTIADEVTTVPPISSSHMAEDTNKPENNPDYPLEQLVVSASVGNIRGTASTSGMILDKVKKGTIVSKVSQTDDWIQIRLENGTFAWGHQSIFKSQASTSGTDLPEPTEPAVKIPAQSASDSNKSWAVNLMSLGSEAAAEKQVAHFQGMGIKAEYALIPVKGKVWYRVRIADFANEKDAIAYKKLLSEKHSISSWHNRM